jgi:hypothetical protein
LLDIVITDKNLHRAFLFDPVIDSRSPKALEPLVPRLLYNSAAARKWARGRQRTIGTG